MDKKEDSPLIDFTVVVDAADWLKTESEIRKSVKTMDKMKEDSQLIDFTVAVDAADWLKTESEIRKSVKSIKSYRWTRDDGRLHVSCYAEPNKLMTCLQNEGKRIRLVHWQCGEARTEGSPSTVSFTVHLRVDNEDWMTLQKKLLKIMFQGYISITKKDDNDGLDISGCCEPNTFMNYLQEAGNIGHLVYWRACATNLCKNTFYHPVAIGHRDYKDKAENPSFVNYSDTKGSSYKDKSRSPCAACMQSSQTREKPYANKAGICSCCIM